MYNYEVIVYAISGFANAQNSSLFGANLTDSIKEEQFHVL